MEYDSGKCYHLERGHCHEHCFPCKLFYENHMTIGQIREKVIQAYPDSKTWPARVSRMTDGQVYAIYSRLSQEGKIR